MDPTAIQKIADTPPVFVFGSVRSGTTIVQAMLASHPELDCAYETAFPVDVGLSPRAQRAAPDQLLEAILGHPGFMHLKIDPDELRLVVRALVPSSFAELTRIVLAAHAHSLGKQRFGDKTPKYCFHVGDLARMFPDARLVHVVRDGRQAATSSTRVPGFPTRSDVVAEAMLWRRAVTVAGAQGRRLRPGTYREVRYEQLTSDPDSTARELCEFIGVAFDGTMLQYHEDARSFVPQQYFVPGLHDNLFEGSRAESPALDRRAHERRHPSRRVPAPPSFAAVRL